jgi:uncharacterized protein (TIGR03435 family)
VERVLTIILVAVQSVALTARQPALRFEVASVKPNNTDAEPSMTVPPRGSVAIVNVPLQNVIVNAYGIPAFRVLDAPEWIRRERFDIAAKIPDDAAPGQTLSMLQTLLAERFKLRVHRETREQPIYTLLIARADRRLGPRLKQSTADCTTPASARSAVPFSPDGPCRALFGWGPAGGRIISYGQPLSRVTRALSMGMSREVVDRTDLQGPFDLEFEWSSDLGAAAANGNTPSIFTALQEQLGLRLEPARGPLDVLVIDSVERPTPD